MLKRKIARHVQEHRLYLRKLQIPITESGCYSVLNGSTSVSQKGVSIGFNWGERGGGIKDPGKLPSSAGVCVTTGCTSARPEQDHDLWENKPSL